MLDRVVVGSPISFRLRASEFANLFYQIECLAGTARCSRAAYEDVWSKNRELGGLDEGDRAALQRWRLLRERYRGRIERDGETLDIGLPVLRARRHVEARLRIAGYTADTLARYAENLSFFVDPLDVAESLSIVGRFQARFARWWASKIGNLARSIDGYARLFARADVKEVFAEAARLYRPEFPSGYVMDLELLARPAHDSPTSGQLIGLVGLVEVLDDEPPEKRFPIVAHEIFHAWLASAAYEPMAALVRKFTSSSDENAVGAYGLLDESLATMLGNGRMARVVERDDFQKRLAMPGGFYNDRFIDATAKSLLLAFDKKAPGSDSTEDARFFDTYLAAVHAAFPAGLPPIARMRPLACLYDKSMRGAYDHLGDVSNSGQLVSDDELDAKTMRELLENRGSWPLALIVPLATCSAP